MHQASTPQIVFAQNPSEQSECAGNLSEEGGWGFSAPYPTASSPSTHFLASVTFSFHGKPFLLQWGLFSLGSQPCSVSDQHPDLLHVSAFSLFPLLSIKATKEPKATLLIRQQAEAGKEHEMQKNTHTCMYVHTHRKFYVTFYLRI